MKCQILFCGGKKNKKNISICHLLKILPRMLSVYILFNSLPRSIWVAKWLAFPTSAHKVTGSNPTGSGIHLMTVQPSIAQSLSLSPFSGPDMT